MMLIEPCERPGHAAGCRCTNHVCRGRDGECTAQWSHLAGCREAE